MNTFPIIFRLILLLGTTVFVQGVQLTISNAVIAPDGFNRSAIVINGATPGTVITGTKGGRFSINVVNRLTDESMNRSTSIHWHGVVQHHYNAMDGTAFVTQCPIATGNSFLYDFTVPTQAGTFWYHSHFRLQYCEGLRGPFIVYDPQDPYLGMYDVDDCKQPFYLHTLPIYIDTAVINVIYGKRYRIRLLNMGCKPSYNFYIDNHTFTVIEADGEPTEPLVVDSIPIYAAQRYSFILEANQTVDNYWIRANATSYKSSFTNGMNSAILRYAGAPIQEPPTRNWTSSNALAESNLHALINPGAPGVPGVGNADVNLNLVSQINQTTLLFEINGVAYHSPSTPVLLQILSGTVNTSQLQPQGSVYGLPPNKVIEVSIPGALLAAAHPFHLHGHAFDVVRSEGMTGYNYVNPVRRDTLSTGSTTDNVTIRFTTDNPGPWFLHCHIDWHLDQGMAVVFAEDPADTASFDPVNSRYLWWTCALVAY
ncbi:hypothetical protein ID866_7290 [Astraeus odoratus]|nr:hypothetical protein ID866_7290 [Astraeus odoratus]